MSPGRDPAVVVAETRIELLATALTNLARVTAAHVCWHHGADANEIAGALEGARAALDRAAPRARIAA